MASLGYCQDEPPGEGHRAPLYHEPWVSESSSGEGIGDHTRCALCEVYLHRPITGEGLTIGTIIVNNPFDRHLAR